MMTTIIFNIKISLYFFAKEKFDQITPQNIGCIYIDLDNIYHLYSP